MGRIVSTKNLGLVSLMNSIVLISSNSQSEDQATVQLPTPKTPRHRDALSKRIPITPRHRIGLVGKPLTAHTPRTPSTPSNAPTVYKSARQLFTRSADPGSLVGRDEERKALQSFIEQSVSSQNGGCMYVSGPPGTGKSALVNEVCRNIQSSTRATAYINCMSAKCSKDIYDKLVEELLDEDIESEMDATVRLRAVLVPRKKSSGGVYVVTLDEMDHLLTLDLEILYTLFEWSLHRSSRLVVIGIANALDLTDRFLPRLKARNLKPQLLPFLPYTAPQIASIISTKLRSHISAKSTDPNDYIPFFHPAAVQLCSKKVASQTGDLRRAFDIVRRTIDLVEEETKRKRQRDLFTCSPSKVAIYEETSSRQAGQATLTQETSLADLTALTAPRATIAHVSRVSASSMSNGTTQRLQSLNLQQKAALCSLISHQKSVNRSASSIFATPTKSCTAPTIGKLYGIYCSLCRQENALHPLTNTEFVDIVSGLETLGLVGEERAGRGLGAVSRTPTKKSKGMTEDRRIVALADEEEMKGSLDEVGRGILLGLLGCEL